MYSERILLKVLCSEIYSDGYWKKLESQNHGGWKRLPRSSSLASQFLLRF